MADGRQSEDYLQALAIYDSIFPRYQSAEPQIRRVEEFPGLEAERRSFASDHGQKLALIRPSAMSWTRSCSRMWQRFSTRHAADRVDDRKFYQKRRKAPGFIHVDISRARRICVSN